MRLIRAKFTNWCQHVCNTIDFSDGLNAIRGPNGSGKSNILTGIVFALTGDFSRNSGVKVDNIYQLAGPKERAGISLELVHGPTKLTLERNLRPNSQRLVIEGEEHPITKADEINSKVRELLGVNERLLLDYVFVDQWKLFQFLDQSPTVRAEAFGELFNAAKAKSIWKLLGDFKVDVPVPAIDGDKVRVRIAETGYEIIQLQTELAKYNHLSEKCDYAQDPLHNVVKQWERKEQLTRQVEQVKQKLHALATPLSDYDRLLKPLEEDIATRQTTINGNKIEIEQAKIDWAGWTAFEQADKARAMLENEIDQLRKEREVFKIPEKPADYNGPHYQIHEEQLANWRAEVAASQKLLQTFDPKSGLAACPTCNTPVTNLQDKLQLAFSDAKNYKDNILALSDRMMRSRVYDTNLIAHSEREKRNTEATEVAQARLISLGTVRRPTKNRSELKQVVDDYAEIQVQIDVAEKEANGYRTEKARLEGQKSQLDNQLFNLTVELESIRVTAEQATTAKTQLEQKQDQFNTRNNLRYKLDTKQRLLQDDEAALQKFILDERKAGRLRRLSTHLDDVRGIFKELPQVAAQACLDSMVEETNDVLEKFDAPFRVLNVDNLKFTLRKHSGITLPAERLSGGEKAVFSLAFRIVVNSRFAGSLGLLCLDEPTAGLDEDNVACLEVALGRLRELSASRGLQVVLITHETGLDGLFDRVIKLSPAH